MQERIEASWLGRAAISSVLIFILGAIAVSNLPPESYIRKVQLERVKPFLNSAGLKQNWGVFAPNAARVSTYVSARITYADGRSVMWRSPAGDKVITPYREYRWRKLGSALTSTRNRRLHRSFAQWLAQRYTEGDVRPVRVSLLQRTRRTPPPGTEVDNPWKQRTIYTLRLDDRAGPQDSTGR